MKSDKIQRNWDAFTQNSREFSKHMHDAKKILEKEWIHLNKYRISDQVHMVETEILRRLHQDGAFPWLTNSNRNIPLTQLRLSFIMRRTPAIRYQFAAAVGKRLFSAKVCPHRSSLFITYNISHSA